jgi:hypothetical protein
MKALTPETAADRFDLACDAATDAKITKAADSARWAEASAEFRAAYDALPPNPHCWGTQGVAA